MTTARLQVNDTEVTWDERPRLRPKPCRNCHVVTRGRMTVRRGTAPPEVQPICQGCSIPLMAELAFRPVGEAVRAIREALAPSQGGAR